MKKEFKSIMLVIIVAIVIVPIVLNYLCLTTTPIPIVGDGKIWIVFWGSYLGGIITVLSTIYVYCKKNEQEKNKKKYEMQKEYFERLCVDLAKLCSSINTDMFAFYFMNMKEEKNAILSIREIGELEKNIKNDYNEFCLKHAHKRGAEGEILLKTFNDIYRSISRQIDIVHEIVAEKLSKHVDMAVYYSTISKVCNDLEVLGDVGGRLYPMAEKWKKREREVMETYRIKYEEG